MSRIAYVNGQYCPISDPHIRIEDRGYQFADGIYEVCLVVDGQYWDEAGHLARMQRSLRELQIPFTQSMASLKVNMRELLRRNRLRDALVYIQITRGVAPRNHPFPDKPVKPVLVMTAKPFSLKQSDQLAEKGVSVVTTDDIRWRRCDIKSISLLPNALAKQEAKTKGAFEAWLIRDGEVMEGSSSNAWIITQNGVVVTHPLSHDILGGITRASVMAVAREQQLKIEERPFSLADAMEAKETFLSSASSLVMPVVSIDGQAVGEGKPGPLTLELRNAYKDYACTGTHTG